uniref:RRM domain-containing protein n=1 Tax=Salix viminalis TaxID=40686 RepID=A0A6N2L0Z8_SALVM
MSTSGQPQFRYTQTPSKVLHLRNLPWECTEEELIELCEPFGKIVNTKCNVGNNRNQAFVEFVEQNQAIQMVSYYASSSEPAQVRGKTVYIQYSNRHEIVNNKSPGDNPGNVLLVTIEGVEAGDVSIDVIHLVFSAFGYVHKIATFEKAAGFQVRYLLPEHVGSCNLRISYSAHTDLNIKFQSHRSRDYTNPYLPVNPTAIDGPVQSTVGADGKRKEPESNVLLASIENMQYAVTVDVLHTVFSGFGNVQKIAIFEKNGGTQALIQYPDVATAAVAKETLEGHCIYDGGYCKLHLSYSRHTDLNVKAFSDKSRDYTIPNASFLTSQAPGLHTAPTIWQNPQAGSMYPGSNYASTAAAAQVPPGQVPAWDQTMQAGGPGYASARGTYPGQTYPTPPAYASSAIPPGSSPLSYSSPISPGVASMGMTHPGVQPNMRLGGASPPGQAPYYGR